MVVRDIPIALAMALTPSIQRLRPSVAAHIRNVASSNRPGSA